MKTTYSGLLQNLRSYRAANYASDPERETARLDAIETTLEGLLAMEAAKSEPPARPVKG